MHLPGANKLTWKLQTPRVCRFEIYKVLIYCDSKWIGKHDYTLYIAGVQGKQLLLLGV